MKEHRKKFIFVFRAFQRFLVLLFKAVFGALATHKNNCLTNTVKWKRVGGPRGGEWEREFSWP